MVFVFFTGAFFGAALVLLLLLGVTFNEARAHKRNEDDDEK